MKISLPIVGSYAMVNLLSKYYDKRQDFPTWESPAKSTLNTIGFIFSAIFLNFVIYLFFILRKILFSHKLKFFYINFAFYLKLKLNKSIKNVKITTIIKYKQYINFIINLLINKKEKFIR